MSHAYAVVDLFNVPCVRFQILWAIDVEGCAGSVVSGDDFQGVVAVYVATPQGMSAVEFVADEVPFPRVCSDVAGRFVPDEFIAVPGFDGKDFIYAIPIHIYCISLAAFAGAYGPPVPIFRESVPFGRLKPDQAVACAEQ